MPSLSKLKHIELSDGWSFVARPQKGGRLPKKTAASTTQITEQESDTFDEASITRTIADVRQLVVDVTEALKAPPKQLPPLSNAFKRSASTDPVTTAVCLGLGPLVSGPSHKRSQIQLAGFIGLLEIARILQEPLPIKATAIDPAFGEADTKVLAEFGIDTCTELDDVTLSHLPQSICYAPYLPWPALLLDYLQEGARKPTIIICQNIKFVQERLDVQYRFFGDQSFTFIDGRKVCKMDWPKAIAACDVILGAYDVSWFPANDTMYDAFRDLVVHTRNDGEEPQTAATGP